MSVDQENILYLRGRGERIIAEKKFDKTCLYFHFYRLWPLFSSIQFMTLESTLVKVYAFKITYEGINKIRNV